MKKIILSLAVVAVVAVVAVGATRALFSDTEVATGTFTAGTIDIAIDTQNPWTSNYNIGDLKPGETGNINFDITNVGTNPVNVSKNLSNWQESTGSTSYACTGVSGGVSSEPECVAAQANSNVDKNDVQSKILYDLRVDVFANGTDVTPIWWQTIYTGAAGETLSSIYPNNSTYVSLGVIPPGGHMVVTQSYHFDSNAGNEYQGDTLSFDMTIKGEQLTGDNGYASVVLENKVQGQNDIWDIVQDSTQGTLNYQTMGDQFVYNFTATDLTPAVSYQLVYYPDPWANPKNVVLIGSPMLADGGGDIALVSNSVELGIDLPTATDANYPTGAKIWLVPTTDLSGTQLSWNPTGFLFETGLINYNDTNN